MIFLQKETSLHLVRKLYRWFVYYRIDNKIEESIIEPLADFFIANNFELKPLLKKLLSSEHFFDVNIHGCIIKNPLEFTIGMARQLEMNIPNESDVMGQYGFFNVIRYLTKNMDLDLGNPPDVAGWPAWYLSPAFNEIWINTATIPNRANYVKQLISWGIRPLSGYDKIYIDSFKVAYLAITPSDINNLVQTLATLLFPVALSENKINELKEILIPGLPDFEWTVEWNNYINNPEDENQKSAIEKQLKDLLTKMCSMAEYQLT